MKDDQSSREHDAKPQGDGSLEPATRPLEPLPTPVRVVFFLAGSVLVILGLVALALPVVPQAIPLGAGAALLSLASDKVYLALKTRLRRWPWIWKPVRAFRRKAHALFARNRNGQAPGADPSHDVKESRDSGQEIDSDRRTDSSD